MHEYKTAIITGAASGMGFETTKVFARNPNYRRILAVDKNPDVLTSFSDGSYIRPVVLDVTKTEDVGEFIGNVLDGGNIDVLVNGAGVMNVGRKETYQKNGEWSKEYQDMFDVHFAAPLRLMNLVVPSMRGQGGVVINITSTKEYNPDPYHIPYADLKSTMTRETLAISKKERPNGVRVVALQPGNTKTNIDRGVWTPGSDEKEAYYVQTLQDWWRGKFGNNPRNVAETIYDIAEGKIDRDRVLTGIDAKLAHALYHRLPGWETMFSAGYKVALGLTRLNSIIKRNG